MGRVIYSTVEVRYITWVTTVSVVPRIEPFGFGDPIYDGQSTQVTCFVSEGDLPLNLSWTYHGDTDNLPLRSGISINKMGSKVSVFYIDAASSYHAGNYTCIATNRAGRANFTATLNVHGKIRLGDVIKKPLSYACCL